MRLYRLLTICGAMTFCSGGAYAETANLPVTITKVGVIPESGNSFSSRFDLQVAKNITDWKLGFFMLQVLSKPGYQIQMQICDVSSLQCGNLLLDRNPVPYSLKGVESQDFTSGHITILKPATKFELNKGHNYQVRIQGLKNVPKNISMMPQSFFLLDQTQVIPLVVKEYDTRFYNESTLVSVEANTIKERWHGNIAPISPLVPLPQQVMYGKGFLNLESQIRVNNSFGNSAGAYYVLRQIQNSLEHVEGIANSDNAKMSLNIFNCNAHPVECEELNDNPEGYRLEIKPQGINLYAIDAPGLFYGYQSLLQLFYFYGKSLPFQEIIDYPEYKYRGLMLDVARHYFTTTQIKQIIDVMAMHKLNTLHLHLADDEAWRIALSKYPELTRQSGIRYQGYKIGPSNLIDGKFDITNTQKTQYENAATQYQGIYTTQAILDLISYANLQGIKIIPEIEMPSHARSLKKALPKLYDFSKPVSYLSGGYSDNVLPVYKYGTDEYFTNTINGITTDVANLFSGQFVANNISHEISLSGDEVPLGAYPESASVAAVSQEFFMKLSANLDDYRISGWQQMVQNDDGTIGENVIKPDHVGHIWAWLPVENKNGISGMEMAKQLLEQEYPVVADFADYAYLDIRYSQRFMEPGLYWSTPYVDTWKTFMLGRQVAPLKAEYKTFAGVEGALWTELVPGQEHLWYMLLPKLSGIAEAGWSNPQTDNWEEFSRRLGCGNKGFLNYIAINAKVNYRGYPSGMALELPTNACFKGK